MILSTALTAVYSAVRQTGLLRVPLMQRGYQAAYFAYKRWVEDPYASFARHYPELLAGGDIIDVGAHIGYTSVVFASMVDPGCQVIAFEPDPANFAALRRTIESRGLMSTIVPVHAAVGAQPGPAQLWLNDRNHGDHRVVTTHFANSPTFRADPGSHTVDIEMRTIDDLIETGPGRRRITFVKIDVQGYEQEVLAGMRETFRQNPLLTVAFEYAPDSISAIGFEPDEVIVHFTNQSVPLYLLSLDGRLRPFSVPLLTEQLRPRGYVDLVATRRDIRP